MDATPDRLTAESWVRRRPDRAGLRRDALGAALLALGAGLSATLYGMINLYEQPVHLGWTALWVLAATLPIAFRRRWPIAVALWIAAVFVLGSITGVQEFLFNNIVLFIALYSVGAWSQQRFWAMVCRVGISVAMVLWLVLAMVWSSAAGAAAQALDAGERSVSAQVAVLGINLVVNLLYFSGAYWFGDAMYGAARERALLEARTAELDTERAVAARQAVSLERLRIARELHDVAAHHVSLIGVQAAAARRRLERGRPDAAAEHLGEVERSARSAVSELRQVLRTLRAEAEDGPVSTLGADRIAELVAESERAGHPARLQVIGAPRTLPATVDLTLYRVAQEGLSNVRRHGAGAAADLRLRYLAEAVELEVLDDGPGARRRPDAAPGLGITGITERVAAVGGEAAVGPRPEQGWRVLVRVPLERSAATRAGAGAAGGR